MRILHTADIHLESSFVKLAPSQVKERKEELFLVLSRMIEEASRMGCRAVIIAGDLFDTERITKRAAERVTNLIERHPEMDFLYLRGNHEGEAFINKIDRKPDNLRIFSDGWSSFDYGDTVIWGRNIPSPTMFSELTVDRDKKNIVVLHGAVVDHATSGEEISLSEASRRGIDYIALGHYHSYTEYRIDERCSAVFCGSPEGRGFDEPGEHGFVLIDTDSSPVGYRFCPAAKRRIRIVKVDISGLERRLDIEDAIADALAGIAPTDLVRILIVGERPPELYADRDAILQRWQSRFYYLELKDESKMKIDPMKYAYDKTLKGEFIRLVSSRTDIDEEARDRVIRLGIRALLGDDLEI
ncbi:MAG: DNA repair exonuclease [Clostridia bacterium]|nr:DNA repair exonuclease [Clostridia bacterium]